MCKKTWEAIYRKKITFGQNLQSPELARLIGTTNSKL